MSDDQPVLHNYEAFYKGKRISVQAETSYKAQQIAAQKFNAKKAYQVSVVLADKPIEPAGL